MSKEKEYDFDKLDTINTADPICPHCGNGLYGVDTDLPMSDGAQTLLQCDACEKDFVAVIHISIEYSTYRKSDVEVSATKTKEESK